MQGEGRGWGGRKGLASVRFLPRLQRALREGAEARNRWPGGDAAAGGRAARGYRCGRGSWHPPLARLRPRVTAGPRGAEDRARPVPSPGGREDRSPSSRAGLGSWLSPDGPSPGRGLGGGLNPDTHQAGDSQAARRSGGRARRPGLGLGVGLGTGTPTPSPPSRLQESSRATRAGRRGRGFEPSGPKPWSLDG